MSSELTDRRSLGPDREAAERLQQSGTKRSFRRAFSWSGPPTSRDGTIGRCPGGRTHRGGIRSRPLLLKLCVRFRSVEGCFAVEFSRNLNSTCRIRGICAFRVIRTGGRSGIRSCADEVVQARKHALNDLPDLDSPLFYSNYRLFSEHTDVVQRLPERRGD